MSKPTQALMALITAVAASAAHAEFYTGNQLLNMMNGTNIERMHAVGYVVGVADVWAGIRFCANANVTAGQVNDVVQQYLTNNPQSRHQTADFLTLNALSNAWPCANRNGGRGV